MNKLKKRFKRALFAFFKQEILKLVGYDIRTKHIQVDYSKIKLVEIKSEIVFYKEHLKHPELAYERSLEDCKRKLFKESMKYIKIDKKSMLDPIIYGGRSIKVSLFIGKFKSDYD